MEKTPNGIYSILQKSPIWAVTAISLIVLEMVMVGRYFFEGIMYNVSFASSIGDLSLMVVLLIATTILQRPSVDMSKACAFEKVGQIVLMVLCVALGVLVSVFTLKTRNGFQMDIYHDVVVGSFFLFLAITLLPIIFKLGKPSEKVASVCFILIWAFLVWFDASHGIFPSQRQWLFNHNNIILQMKSDL